MFTVKDILICTFVVAAGIIIELRFEKKMFHDEKWKQQMSEDINDIKTSNKQLIEEFNRIKSKPDPCDIYLISGYGKELVSFTASSSYDQNHGPHRGFLNAESSSVGSWCAKRNDNQQYLQVFVGNSAGDDIKKNFFPEPVKAKCIRVNPLTWHIHVSMRMDVIGCRIN